MLDAIHAEQIAQITEAVSSAASFEERIARLQRWAEENIGDEARTTLEVEFALAVRHDEHLRRELAGRDKGMRDVIADLVRESTERFDVDVPMPADNLAAVGIDRAKLERVRAPIGLEIGAQTPEEIAVSIIAEIIAVRRGGRGLPMSEVARNRALRVAR